MSTRIASEQAQYETFVERNMNEHAKPSFSSSIPLPMVGAGNAYANSDNGNASGACADSNVGCGSGCGCASQEPQVDMERIRTRLKNARGQQLWRSLEELSGTPEFTRYLQKEFPRQAPRDMMPLSRRDFMRLMGAAMALAGVGGCAFQPAEKIVPYVDAPEEQIPGIPLFYATAFTHNGHAMGVLAENHMGRPTKLEGNPDHPASLGRADIWAQAAILSLYDPDRSQNIRQGGTPSSWQDFAGELNTLAQRFKANGSGLRVLTGTVNSPTLASQLAEVSRRFPGARWHQYDPINRDNARAGATLAFGRDVLVRPRFDLADVVVSLDCDFLLEEPNHVRHARDFISRRKPQRKGEPNVAPGPMSRLYVVESTPRNTGAMADHRLPLKASEIQGFAAALAGRLGVSGASGEVKDTAFLDAVVKDLQGARGRSLVVAGMAQPPVVHALAHAINERLGNNGKTVEYSDAPEERPEDQLESLQALVSDMNAGRVETLLVLDANPVYNAPADLKFADALKKVKNTIHVGLYDDETGSLCGWHVPESHFLEAWSDVRAFDGTISIVQPLIVPLYGATKSAHEVLAVLLGQGDVSSLDVVRGAWESRLSPELAALRRTAGTAGALSARGNSTSAGRSGLSGQDNAGGLSGTGDAEGNRRVTQGTTNPDGTGGAVDNLPNNRLTALGVAFDKQWQTILHNGIVPNTALPTRPVRVTGNIAGALAEESTPQVQAGALEAIFRPDPTIWDGRYANNGWLQELPKPLTKLTWDNAAIISPITAEKLGLDQNDEVTLTLNGASATAGVLMLPGHPEDSVTLHLGYGRQRAGKIGNGTGFNAFALRSSKTPFIAQGLKVEKTGRKYKLAVTSHHNLVDLRENARELDGKKAIDGTHERDLIRVGTYANFVKGEQEKASLSEKDKKEKGTHFWPVQKDDQKGLPLYKDKYTGVEPRDDASDLKPNGLPSLYPENTDITDRYKDPEVEKAARAAGKMPYQWGMAIDLNACIGCNACVIGCQSENNVAITGKDQVLEGREMHWLRIDTYYKGELENPRAYFQPVTCMHCEKAPCEPVCPVAAPVHSPEGLNEQIYNRCVGTKYCENNCPYKVRRFNFLQYSDQQTPVIQMMQNPDVTVRSRGVMEKCTYCIQRINSAKYQAEKEDRQVRDDELLTACQQTCPTDAIVFGNINDLNSRVRKLKDSQMNYGLLTELNTVPRTTYHARIVNVSTDIVPEDKFDTIEMKGAHHGGEHAAGHGGKSGKDHGAPHGAPHGETHGGASETH
jgi:MoCo/4Fe-4S cofactor protein with predicted Tat translocation signal